MPMLMTGGAMMTCSFGAAPASLAVLPVNRVTAGGMPAATVMDTAPIVNIPPFGVCNSPSNPTVAAATAAALGVLTPMPCVPATPAPWAPGVPAAMIGSAPACDSSCKLTCLWGGLIQFTTAGQTSVQA